MTIEPKCKARGRSTPTPTPQEMKRRVAAGVLAVVCVVAWAGASWGAEAEDMLDASGVQGGLVVHVGCDEGRLTAKLCANDRYLVHGLDTKVGRVDRARRHIRSLDLYGRASIETFDGRHLPYVDNLVSLIVVGRSYDVSGDEVARVLEPGGAVLIRADAGNMAVPPMLKTVESSVDGWTKLVKPRTDDIDEWTHFLRDASGNAVARDRRVGPPRHMQWMSGPKRSRDHDALASMSAMTSSGGRVFYIFDEGHTSLIHRPPKWKLVARGAFNGVLLWKRDIPTWITHLFYFRTGPVQMPRRLVSVGDRVYVTLGFNAPVSALDAATGETLRTFKGSEKTEEIIHHNGTLLTVIGDPDVMNDEAPKVYGYWQLSVRRKPKLRKSVAAYDAAGGELRWKKTDENLAYLAPLSLTASGDKVFFLDNENLHCVSLDDGEELWRAAFPSEGLFLRSYAPTVVAYDDVVMCMTWDRLHAFSMADGRKLWGRKGAVGFASPGDLFAIDGLAWAIPMTSSIWNGSTRGRNGKIRSGVNIPREKFIGNKAKEIWGVDIHTGEVKRTFPRMKLLPGGHHHRCYRNKATERYLICGRRGLEYIDLAGENHVNNWWLRGICQYGVMPANGYIYVPPDPCQCFNLIKLNFFNALAAESSLDELQAGDMQPLEKGPAFTTVAKKKPQGEEEAEAKATDAAAETDQAWRPPIYPSEADEWPTLRGNITRSGSTKSRVSAKLESRWRARVDRRLTAPVIAGDRLVVCSKKSFTVHCLDAKTGKSLWEFIPGGRVDSPPTLYDGLCVFGCDDGSVYCLRASDGELAWRFIVGPVDRRVVADNRLASVWPVHGSVLVQEGVVYCAAGRSSYLDGGIRICGLDVYSGEKLCESKISATPVYPGKKRPEGPSIGALPDVLVSDGTLLNMRGLQFNKDLELQGSARLRTLCASTGLLEGIWAHRQNMCLGRPGKINSRARRGGLGARSNRPHYPAGKLIVFDARFAYDVKNPYGRLKHTRSLWPEGHNGHLHQKYSRYKADDFLVGVSIASTRNGPARWSKKSRRGKKPATEPAGDTWAIRKPIQPRAVVLADDTLFMAGWRDAVAVREKTGRPLEPDNPYPRPSFLWVYSASDGNKTAEHKLDSEPVFDGMAAAYGRLFLCMKDGTVRCFGAAD